MSIEVKKVLVPGSFDPVTKGHIDVIERCAGIFDEVYVVVFDNSNKRYMFSAKDRKRFLEASCEKFGNVKVDVSDGLVAAYAESHGIKTIAKGVRDTIDFEYEKQLFEINKSLDEKLDTIFIPASPDVRYISSTVAREMICYNRDISKYVPKEAVDLIKM